MSKIGAELQGPGDLQFQSNLTNLSNQTLVSTKNHFQIFLGEQCPGLENKRPTRHRRAGRQKSQAGKHQSASGRSNIKMPTDSKEKTDNMKKPGLLHGLDIAIIVALLFVSVAFIPFMRSQPCETVLVYKGADEIGKYPLDEDRVFHVDGVDGALEIEIRNEKVRVRSSPCQHQVCVNTGWISRSYEQIICAPNHIIVLIRSNPEEEEIDAVSYRE